MKRNNHYMQKTLRELIEMYADENNRINKKDAEITQIGGGNAQTKAYVRVKNELHNYYNSEIELKGGVTAAHRDMYVLCH